MVVKEERQKIRFGNTRKTKREGVVMATNAELLKIAAGINHIIIRHDSRWSLLPGMGADKVFDVGFSKPVLRRPLRDSDKQVAQEWAKYHPRMWRIVLMLDMFDGAKHYFDSAEIETIQPCKLNELKEYVNENWQELENKNNPKHIIGRRWEARIIKTHEQKRAKQ